MVSEDEVMPDDIARATRRLLKVFEPVHSISYYSPEIQALKDEATAVWKSTSHIVGASAEYASPRLTRSRNARCEMRRERSSIVA